VHPFSGLTIGIDAALAELLERVEALQLDFELQSCAAVAARERHEQSRLQLLALGGFDFALNEIHGALAVYG
jgi:hypothetical protein